MWFHIPIVLSLFEPWTQPEFFLSLNLALINILWEIPLWKGRRQLSFPKVVLLLHWGLPSYCSCNFFPKFLKIFGPSFWFYLAWECLDCWILFFPLLHFGLFEVELRSNCFFFFSETVFCLPMLLTIEFTVWFENDALLI